MPKLVKIPVVGIEEVMKLAPERTDPDACDHPMADHCHHASDETGICECPCHDIFAPIVANVVQVPITTISPDQEHVHFHHVSIGQTLNAILEVISHYDNCPLLLKITDKQIILLCLEEDMIPAIEGIEEIIERAKNGQSEENADGQCT